LRNINSKLIINYFFDWTSRFSSGINIFSLFFSYNFDLISEPNNELIELILGIKEHSCCLFISSCILAFSVCLFFSLASAMLFLYSLSPKKFIFDEVDVFELFIDTE